MNPAVWPAAISAVVASLAFLFSVWVKYRAQRETIVRAWQRVVVYSLIEETNEITFTDLKTKYLQKAQQLLTTNLPKKEIQDDALRRILLDLQRDNVVVRNKALAYQPQIKIPMEAWAFEQLKRMFQEQTLKPKILYIVERENRKHTVDSLYRRLHEQGVTITFEELDEIIYNLRGHSSLRKRPDGKLVFVPSYEESKYYPEDDVSGGEEFTRNVGSE